MNMKIAGINFIITCPHALSTDRLPSAYGQFLRGLSSAAGDIDVNVRIETGNMPDTGRMTKVFDTGQSWAMYRHDRDHVLSLSIPSATGSTIWLAAFDSDCNNITIFCSDLLTDKTDNRTICHTPLSYPLDQLLIMYILARKGGALLHAAGLGMGGRGCIFPGRSGAGKSTLSRLFLGRDSVDMLSDDRVIIRKADNRFMAFGTPWAGNAEIAENRCVILDRIFFIHHSGTNRIKELEPAEAAERLMPVTSIPWHDEDAVQKMLTFCEDLVLHVPAYDLHFRPDSEVVAFLEDFMAREGI